MGGRRGKKGHGGPKGKGQSGGSREKKRGGDPAPVDGSAVVAKGKGGTTAPVHVCFIVHVYVMLQMYTRVIREI